jgi:hypothetical protein
LIINTDRLLQIRAPFFLLLVMVAVLIGAYAYEPAARALPVLVAWTTIILLLLELMVQARTSLGARIQNLLQVRGDDPEPKRVPISRALTYAVVWPGFLVILAAVIGILPAVLLYIFLSLRIVAGKAAQRALVVALAVTTLSWLLFEWVMSYQLYRGMLINGLNL